MSQACSISTGKVYGLKRVCHMWNVPRSTVYARRQRKSFPRPVTRRLVRFYLVCQSRKGPCIDEELAQHIRTVLLESPFHGEGYRKVWAKLRYKGIRTSKERTRRVMRENNLLAPQRAGNCHGPKAHDGTITTDVPSEVWGTDMTATVTTKEGKAAVCWYSCIKECNTI